MISMEMFTIIVTKFFTISVIFGNFITFLMILAKIPTIFATF